MGAPPAPEEIVTQPTDPPVFNSAMSDFSDAELVRSVLNGRIDSFAVLVRRHQEGQFRFAVRMLGDRDDADDALQSAFLRAYRGLDGCRDPERFGAWLRQIVVNECRTLASSRQRRDQRLVRSESVLARIEMPGETGGGADFDEIQRALARLSDDYREAFLLKYGEEHSYEEMAEITGVGISALKMRVKRACEQLREQLEGVRDA